MKRTCRSWRRSRVRKTRGSGRKGSMRPHTGMATTVLTLSTHTYRFPASAPGPPILWQLRGDRRVQSPKQQEGHLVMGKKIIATALAVFAFAFGSALRSNAGTDMIEPYTAPPSYNYAPLPPPRPVLYVPQPVIGVVVAPTYGYYGRRFLGYGGHRFYGRHGHWRSHHHWR
jgi:hypothetical protein